MKRNFLFIILTLIAFNLSAQEPAQEPAQGISYYKAGFSDVAKPLLLKEFTTNPSALSETCFYLGNIYFSENKIDSAAIYFNKGLTDKPTNALNSIGLTMIKIKSNPKQADLDFQALLKLPANKKNVDYYVAIGHAYLVNGLIDQASNYLEKAKAIKLKYSAVAVLAGDIELAKKNAGNACSNYELAILYDASCKEAYIKYARAYKDVNPPLAIEKLKELKAKDPSFLLVDRELADIYYAQEDYNNAAEMYENYLKSGNSDVQDLTRFAYSNFKRKNYEKSLEITKMGLRKAPRNPAFNRLGMYNNTELKKYDEAVKFGDSFFHKSDKPELWYYDYAYYGNALRNMKQYDMAIQQFKNAFKVDTTQIGIWKDISDMYAEIPDYKNAISNYQTFIKSLPPQKRTYDINLNLAKLYYVYGSDEKTTGDLKKTLLQKADSMFAQIGTMDSTDYRSFYYRARTNFALDPELNLGGLAKPYYDKTLTILEPKVKTDARYTDLVVEAYRYNAFYYFLKRDYVQSKLFWNKVLELKPTDPQALTAIDGIDKTMKRRK